MDTGLRVRPESTKAPLDLLPLERALERLERTIAQRGTASLRPSLRLLHEARAALEGLTPPSRVLVEDLFAPERSGILQLHEDLRTASPPTRTRGDLAVLCERLRVVVGLYARSETTGVAPVGVGVSYQRFDVTELARLLTRPFQALASEREMELWVEVGPALEVELDAGHVAELLLGRLTEALLRTPVGGWVHVEVEPARGGRVDLRITDSGSVERPSHESVHGLTPHDRAALLGGCLVEARASSGGWTTQILLPRRAPRLAAIADVTDADRDHWRHGAMIARAAASAVAPAAPSSVTAESARRVKQDFLRMMSHELKTPVTSMRLHLRLLEREAADQLTPRAQERVQRIWRAKQQLLYLIETMLESARYGDGTFHPVVRRFDADSVVGDVLSELGPLTRGNRLERGPRPAEPMVPLPSDPRIVRLILLNLVMHALRRSDDATVALWVEARPGAHVFWLHDGGPSIGPREEREVFAPFEVDLLSRPGTGSGLGLYLVRDLAASIGAEVSVHPPQELRLVVPWLEAPHAPGP